jgi:hypothetical protein
LFLYDIFKVIYSPIKAFREVLENPRYIGPVLIIIISLFLTIGTQYVSVSKHYVETISPTSPRNAWTNMTTPSSMWATNAPPENVTAASNANSDLLAGNYSVLATVTNASEVWLKTTDIGTINCSDSGFRTFYYKLMYSAFNQTQAPQSPQNASLRMFSYNNESRYFEFDLLSDQKYLNTSQAWINANVTLSGWKEVNVSAADWSNITGIEFVLNFTQKGQLSLYLNDLYFGGKYDSILNVFGFANWLSSTVLSSVLDILLRWLIFAALLWLTVKVFQSQGIPFRTLLVVVGYAFAIMFVYLTVDILSISQLPSLYFPNKVIFPLTGREIQAATVATSNIYATYWTSTIAYDAFIGMWYISHVWTIGLYAVALKTLQPSFSWKKAVLMSIIAYVMALFVRAVIPI